MSHQASVGGVGDGLPQRYAGNRVWQAIRWLSRQLAKSPGLNFSSQLRLALSPEALGFGNRILLRTHFSGVPNPQA
jgi:hypothetical protein